MIAMGIRAKRNRFPDRFRTCILVADPTPCSSREVLSGSAEGASLSAISLASSDSPWVALPDVSSSVASGGVPVIFVLITISQCKNRSADWIAWQTVFDRTTV